MNEEYNNKSVYLTILYKHFMRRFVATEFSYYFLATVTIIYIGKMKNERDSKEETNQPKTVVRSPNWLLQVITNLKNYIK